jgi:hypothetical protein
VQQLRERNLTWIMDRAKAEQLPLYTCDLETDPFARGHVPVPFVAGLYDGLTFRDFWTDKKSTCIEKLIQFLESGLLDPGIIYMHNGGRFDFFYLLKNLQGKTMIIGSRIVRAFMPLGNSHSKNPTEQRFEFRDSYAIMPFPLAAYKKDKLPIEYLARENRDQHREEITTYLTGDCVYLWDLCMEFAREFGDYKTIASAAFAQLGTFHKFDTLSQKQDEVIRSKFYFGGRVQCFEKGLIETKGKSSIGIYDVNSMYPFVMDSYFHPTGWCTQEDRIVHGWNDDGTFNKEKSKTFFLTVEGKNDGAFPQRTKAGPIDFTVAYGVFHVTIHEWLAAMQLDKFRPGRILATYNFSDYSVFHLFVDHFYRAREKAKREGDIMHSLFYKYILNSAYGKFGLNPENYFNWEITRTSEPPKGKAWELDTLTQGSFYIWKQPTNTPWNVKNIGTAASITGAARSVLLRAIAASGRVLYCDTDSILCESFSGGAIDDKKLGAWKCEGTGIQAAIAGKKMYAVFNHTGDCIKHACKGVDLTPDEIRRLCSGESILSERDAPTFKRDGSATFISRTARMT